MQKPIRLEVTGTSSPRVRPRDPLWILEGKARYAEDHPDEDVYIVHVLDAPDLGKPLVRAIRAAGLTARYPVEVKRPYGAPERYVVVPAHAPEVLREEVFFHWLALSADASRADPDGGIDDVTAMFARNAEAGRDASAVMGPSLATMSERSHNGQVVCRPVVAPATESRYSQPRLPFPPEEAACPSP